MVLNRIHKENDIQKIPKEQWPELAADIRECILENVSETGGHLSSSLGVVELTMALHLSLNLPKDKILWDVGHQSYAHKILTGRKEQFQTLRQYGGISGFPNPLESDCDAFLMGHASTSISAALGFAKARELAGEDNTIVAVIGDGALTGGMAYEALNNCGQLNSNLIIILNDNEMSISPNVGGISRVLTTIRTGNSYIDLKDNVKNRLSKIPGYGDELIDKIHKSKNSIKHLFLRSSMVEEMGITYLGPVDGHDVNQLVRMIRAAKRIKHAVLIHVHTIKGKGYFYAERKPSFYHGVAPFNRESGELLSVNNQPSYSEVLSKTLVNMAGTDDRIVAITAAMADGTGLKRFEKKYPKRFIDVGIAEEHAVTFAAGMAADGYKPYVAIYSSFLQRAFDQMIHDVCIQKLPVRFIVERAGVVGNDGVTHQGIFDLSYCNMIPNMTILAPRNGAEFKRMLHFSQNYEAPLMIRVPKGEAGSCALSEVSPIEYGRSEVLTKGKKIAILAVGSMVALAGEVQEQLQMLGFAPSVVNARFVKPLDEELIKALSSSHELLITMEENVKAGGYGEAVLSYVNEEQLPIKVLNIALPNEFIPHGSTRLLLEEVGFDAQTITGQILQRIQ